MATDGRTERAAAMAGVQQRLFPDLKLARHALKEELVRPGTYDPVPETVSQRRDLTQAAKQIYGKLLGLLRGSATWVEAGVPWLADKTGLSCRHVRRSLRALEALDDRGRATPATLIETRHRPGRRLMFAFAPLVEPLPEGTDQDRSGSGDVAAGAAIERQNGGPTEVEAEGPQTARMAAKSGPAAGFKGIPSSVPGGGQNVRPTPDKMSGVPRTKCPPPLKTFLRHLPRQKSASDARARAREGNESGEATPPTKTQINVETGPVELAIGWEDLLGLDRLRRADDQQEDDFAELLQIANDALRGALGPPGPALTVLDTVAHQIGRREPAAISPLGMFLKEVGRMRIRAMR